MEHIKSISAVKAVASVEAPQMADAKADLLNTVWLAWGDFRVALKNEKGGQNVG